MSLWQSYVRSSPRAKALVGAGILAWGAVGMAMSDRAESMLGFTPTQEDEKRLQEQVVMYVPKVTVVDKNGRP